MILKGSEPFATIMITCYTYKANLAGKYFINLWFWWKRSLWCYIVRML